MGDNSRNVFYFIEKLHSIFEIFHFYILRHFIIFKSCFIMISVTTLGSLHSFNHGTLLNNSQKQCVQEIFCMIWRTRLWNFALLILSAYCPSTLLCSKKKKRKTGKKERHSPKSKCYCFSHSRASRLETYFLSANHGGQQYFSVFHGPSTLKSILPALK